jgi:FkbM family methyltransferase
VSSKQTRQSSLERCNASRPRDDHQYLVRGYCSWGRNMGNIPDWLENEVDDYFRFVNFESSPRLILDIGANIGAFALRAHKQWPNARILCYEPMPPNLDQLRKNVSPDYGAIFPYAIRGISGVSEIYIGDMFVTSGFVRGPRQTSQKISVQCMAAVELPVADLVKIDTEGSEVEILRGLNLSATSIIMLEHHSKADAKLIKAILAADFRALRDESEREIGTMVFERLSCPA